MMAANTRSLICHAAAAWALIFGVVHIYWALGGRWGLPVGLVMAQEPLLLAVDLVAIPACAAAAMLALALARPQPAGSRVLVVAAWLIAAFCFVHALPPLSAALATVLAGGDPAPGERERLSIYCYEPWWLLGGIIFAGAAIRRKIGT